MIAVLLCRLNDCLKSKGERLVFVLNNLLNDCGCSKPNSYAISLTDKSVADNFSFARSINLSCMNGFVLCPVNILSNSAFAVVLHLQTFPAFDI